MVGLLAWAIIAALAALVVLTLFISWAKWYRKCPSDRIMVIYGKTGGRQAAKCIHGGAKFVWPIFQDYGYISLRPIQINVDLTNALCKQNIRINVPSVFTVGVSTEEVYMGNAAERLSGITPEAISELAKDIIFGQLRLVVASMTIEEINADRETFLRAIEANVTEELKKLGLALLNVNITDITDESDYIRAIGQRAAAEALNQAKIAVADETRKGSIGQAEAERAQRIAVAQAEAEAASGEADADRSRRIAIKQAESAATQGENISAIEIAQSNAHRCEQEAEAFRRSEAARQVASQQIEKARFEAEAEAQVSRAKMEMEKLQAERIVPAEINKRQIEIAAEAEAEKRRREARGEADAIFAKLEAEARGNFELLKAKGEGFNTIIAACGKDADAACRMLLIEKLQELVALQTEAIKNIKIDKVTVWYNGKNADGKTATANFLSGIMQSLPPLHDVANMAGLELPDYLGKVKDSGTEPPVAAATAEPAAEQQKKTNTVKA